ncbi:efflux RND transporter periplasmic adaptor subunit [Caproiciproducens sp. CPB-2]|uniref:efflux RND transporter periplasmic adaptor subunit n=1 Tax=Caproiciproducens sp. CPB-2 TaxID=3030017 RepID=UPI0023DA148C|nr:HlyD family efflux transporter periplasmic adaptor subunit [Caproiciproducens sp. CPB-2]MDF1495104.1 HlyD family efflux transporter periplasmic adaptor subunit [Caproiciproducens sp. CPB-2]
MKKYAMLLSFTSMMVVGILTWGVFSRNSVVPVSIVKVNPVTVENSVTCSGRVERVSTHNVYSPSAAFVSQVYVQLGDKVTQGQRLMDIQVPSSASDSSSSSDSELDGTYESLLNQYSGQSQITTRTITSPYEGKITSLSVANQGYVQAGTPVAVISDNSDMLQVRLSVNESQISDIKKGQKAIITGVGFKNTAYTGTVKSISAEAKQMVSTTGQETVVEVIVSVEKPGSDIKPGYTAKAKIITSENPNVLIAPYNAVRADKNGNEYVFKLKEKKAVKTPVVTDREFDDGFEITSGLSENDEVIANPDSVSNGAHVIPKESSVSSDE